MTFFCQFHFLEAALRARSEAKFWFSLVMTLNFVDGALPRSLWNSYRNDLMINIQACVVSVLYWRWIMLPPAPTGTQDADYVPFVWDSTTSISGKLYSSSSAHVCSPLCRLLALSHILYAILYAAVCSTAETSTLTLVFGSPMSAVSPMSGTIKLGEETVTALLCGDSRTGPEGGVL